MASAAELCALHGGKQGSQKGSVLSDSDSGESSGGSWYFQAKKVMVLCAAGAAAVPLVSMVML